jgi:radical SAM/Cys-rich protein
MDNFRIKLEQNNIALRKKQIDVLQVNVGKLCNLTCVHCHVEAGPTKTKENMDQKTAEAVVGFMHRTDVQTLDITGGAPEINPHFSYLVEEARKKGLRILDRCNLTVFYEPQMDYLPEFLAKTQVEIVASLPCYMKDNSSAAMAQ